MMLQDTKAESVAQSTLADTLVDRQGAEKYRILFTNYINFASRHFNTGMYNLCNVYLLFI